MRIGLDAMGGDFGPSVVVQGALDARKFLEGADRIVLVGDQAAVLPHLQQAPDWPERIDVHHASQAIGMNEPPVEAIRAKRDSSLNVLTQLHAEGAVDACVSSGNTGAFVAVAQMRLRRLAGV